MQFPKALIAYIFNVLVLVDCLHIEKIFSVLFSMSSFSFLCEVIKNHEKLISKQLFKIISIKSFNNLQTAPASQTATVLVKNCCKPSPLDQLKPPPKTFRETSQLRRAFRRGITGRRSKVPPPVRAVNCLRDISSSGSREQGIF